MDPTIGRIVQYRSRGPVGFVTPAIIAATQETLADAGLAAWQNSGGTFGVPPLSSPDHVHLVVFTAGKSDGRAPAEGMEQPFGGTWQEFDVPIWEPSTGVTYDPHSGRPIVGSGEQPAGSWTWPERR